MEPAAHLDALRTEGAALADAARLGLDPPVTSCPGWDVARLVTHVGAVHRWVAQVVATRRFGWRDRSLEPVGLAPGALLAWYEEGLAALVEALEALDPGEPVEHWAIGVNQTAAFWYRRMAQETAVHRWDAQSAHGQAQPLSPGLAVEGVDEMFEVFVPRRLRESEALRSAGPPGSLHLHCTDAPGEWLVRLDGDVPDVRREHAKGDAAVRGGASELLLVLWGRVPPEPPSVEVLGDASVLTRWLALTGG